MQRQFYFTLSLTSKECLDYYKGHFQHIQVVADSGERIRFDAVKLRPFVSKIGIKGRFRLTLDSNNRFVSLERVA